MIRAGLMDDQTLYELFYSLKPEMRQQIKPFATR